MENRLKIIGYIAIALGTIAALLAPYYLIYAIPVGFFGMITSTIYIFIDTRNEINTKKFTAGMLGLLLGSIPVLFILAIIILKQLNH